MITSNNLSSLTQWIMQALGIKVHDHQLESLAKAVNDLFNQNHITNLNDLINKLNKHDSVATQHIIKAITVQESYFFRDHSLFVFLKEIALPQLIQSRRQQGNLSLNIWSAGCAAGEEIYSIAILLYELLPDIKKWRIYLYGSDIHETAIDQARNGYYNKAALRATAEREKQRYFTNDGIGYQLNPEVQTLAQFGLFNLASTNYPAIRFDIILCRNVFIYFASSAIEHALVNFKNCLCDGGYLFLGASDFISYVDHNFKQKTENGITYLIKSPLIATRQSEISTVAVKKLPSYFETQTQKSNTLKEISDAFQQRLFQKTVRLIDIYVDNYGNSDLLYQYKAAALLEIGDMTTALDYCNKAISSNKNNPYIYFIKAMIAMDNKEATEAAQLLKKALFVRPCFVEAQYHLGLLLLRDNHYQEGILALQQALSLAKAKPENDKVFGASQETFKDMVIAIQNDIKFYQGRSYGS